MIDKQAYKNLHFRQLNKLRILLEQTPHKYEKKKILDITEIKEEEIKLLIEISKLSEDKYLKIRKLNIVSKRAGLKIPKGVYYDKKKKRFTCYLLIKRKQTYIGSSITLEGIKEIRNNYIISNKLLFDM